MKNTKQTILHAARDLFNELGYSQVTIRMIASALGMSSGNLNYHFRKREDILEALYFEMVEVFDARVEQLGSQPISLAYLHTEIQSSMERMLAYRFFWTDLYHLLTLNDQITAHFQAVRQDRIKGYQFVFDALISQELMLPPSFAREHLFLGERMIDFSNTWLYVSRLRGGEENREETIARAAFDLQSMLYPHLTEQGKSQFRDLHQSFLEERKGSATNLS